MSAIFRRELQAYFKSPLGYIYLAIIFFFGGMYLQYQVGSVQTNEISTIFSNMFSIVLFTTPLLTMRLMSEDNRQKTDQALLTAPVSIDGIIWGKFLAAFMLYVIGMASTFVYFIVLSAMSSPNWTMFAGNFVGMLTDSRSFLSYTRHEYFRRILCNFLGTLAENGEYHDNVEYLGHMVQDISYNNTVRYFGFNVK